MCSVIVSWIRIESFGSITVSISQNNAISNKIKPTNIYIQQSLPGNIVPQPQSTVKTGIWELLWALR